MQNNDGSLSFQASIDLKQLRKDVASMKQEFASASNKAQVEGAKTQSAINNMLKGAAAYFSIRQATQFANQIVQIRGEFQQLNVAFETMLGNKEKADALMGQVVDFAARTPFELTEVANSTKQLLAYRIEQEKIIPTLKAIGDVSAGLNVPMSRLILNYGQVRTASKLTGRELRDFNMAGVPLISELAKNLNVSEKSISDMVTAGKIGFPEVEQAFKTMTDAGGQFANLMDKQSATITGRISNLQDSIDTMMNKIGESNEGVINSAIDGASHLVENYEEIGKTLVDLIAIYGSYRVALAVANSLQATSIALNAGWTASEMLRYRALVLTEKAQKALNASMLANPYILVGAAIGSLVYALYKFNTATTLAEAAQKRYNDRMEKRKEDADNERQSVQKNINTLKDELSTRSDKQKALEDLQNSYPDLFKSLDIEAAKYLKIDEALKGVNEQLEAKNKLSDQERLNSLQSELDNLNQNPESVIKKINAGIRSGKNATGSYAESFANLLGIGDIEYQEYKESLEAQIKDLDKNLKEAERLKFESLENSQKIAAKQKENEGLKNTLFSNVNLSEKQKQELRKTIAENVKLIEKYQNEELSKPTRSRLDVTKEIAETQSKIKELQSKSIKGITDSEREDLKDYQTTLADLRKELELFTGKKPEKEDDKSDPIKIALENARKLEDAAYELERKKIEAQKDGADKTYELLKLDGERKIVELKRQKEDEISTLSGGKAFEFSSVYDKMITQQQANNKAALQDFLNEQLSQYQTYEQKRAEIVRKGQEEVDSIISLGGKAGLSQGDIEKAVNEAKKAISNALLNLDKSSSQTILGRLFADNSEKTYKELEAIIEDAEREYTKLENSGASSTELESVRNKINELKKSALDSKPLFKEIAENISIILNPESTEGESQKAFRNLINNLQEVKQISDALASSVNFLGDAFGSEALSNIGEVLGDIGNVIDKTTEGAKAGSAFGTVGTVVGGAIGLISSVGTAISKWLDKANEQRIQRLQNQVDSLKDSYVSLSKAIEKAYATDASKLIEQQSKNLEQQKTLLEQQIRAEEAKKKTDQNRIAQWKDAIKQIDETIASTEQRQIEAINGKSVQDAINDFASAYVDAWAAGEDKAKSMKDVVKTMVKSAVSELVKSRLSGEVEAFSRYLASAMEDGILSVAEKNVLDSLELAIGNKLSNLSGTLDEYLLDEAAVRQASQKGFASMSQESANELNGRFTVMQGHTAMIADSIKMLQENSAQGLRHLAGIEVNTSRLENIEKSIGQVKSGIDDINTKGIKLK